MLWNPFAHLVESKKYRLARFFRSSLWLRLKDTFKVFFGGIVVETEMGILDYVFPPARLSLRLFSWINKPQSNTSLVVLALIAAMTFNFIKFVVAGVLTVVLSPLISILHLGIKPFWVRMVNRINEIVIHPVATHTATLSASEFESKIKLKELDKNVLKKYIIEPLSNYPKFSHQFIFGSYFPSESIIFLGLYKSEYSPVFRIFFEPYNSASSKKLEAVIEINNSNWRGILALLKTNAMFASQNLENKLLFKNEDAHQIIERQILPYLAKRTFICGMSRSSKNKSPIKKFVESPTYDTKLSSLIFQFAGLPLHNRRLDPVDFAKERRNMYKLS